jgi:hypothetical protein
MDESTSLPRVYLKLFALAAIPTQQYRKVKDINDPVCRRTQVALEGIVSYALGGVLAVA